MLVIRAISLLFPSLLFLSPFFPPTLISVFSVFNLAVIPLVIIGSKLDLEVFIISLLVVLYFGIYLILSDLTFEMLRYYYLLIITIIMFMVSSQVKSFDYTISKNVSYGATSFNILTILIYGALLAGFIDLDPIYDTLNRVNDIGLSRFSIGNAIVVPLFMAVMFWYGCSQIKGYIIVPAFINLICSVISESRFVIIISILIILKIVFDNRLWGKTSFLIISILIFTLTESDLFGLINIIESIFYRFLGSDSGSAEERMRLFGLITNMQDVPGFLFGHGLGSSTDLVYKFSGEYRTVESFAYQFFYEIGFLGCLFALALIINTLKKINFNNIGLLEYLIVFSVLVQLLFLIPLTEVTPFLIYVLFNKIAIGNVKIVN